MVTIPIHQASSSAPPLSTPIIDLTTPKPVSPPAQEPIFTATTATTTTTLLPPPPPQQQRTTDPALAARVLALEQICANFENKNKVQDQTTQALSSRIFTLENHDLYSKINNYINESIKESIQNALKALVHECFRELSEFEMKEILRDRILKLRCPHPGSLLIQEKLLLAPPSKRLPLNLNSLLMMFQFQMMCAVPPNDLPEPENNWTNALANSYQDPEENKLLRKTSDMGSFIKWYYKQTGKKKLNKVDLEGPAFKVDLANPDGNRVVPDVSKPLPIGGPPGQLKAAYYPDFGLEELVPSLWIKSEHEYYISAAYVRSHMRILSVVSLKTFSRYGYTYLKEIILRRANYKEYKISEADFKNLHPNDFEDLYLLHFQGNLNHLSGADEVHLFNAVDVR
ncbi:hypothetical protein Tco_1540968 [Tanacetum coccineum]